MTIFTSWLFSCLTLASLTMKLLEASFLAETGKHLFQIFEVNKTIELSGGRNQVPGNRGGDSHVQSMTVFNQTTSTTSNKEYNESMALLEDDKMWQKYTYNVFAVVLMVICVLGVLVFGCFISEKTEATFTQGWEKKNRGENPPYRFLRSYAMKIQYIDDKEIEQLKTEPLLEYPGKLLESLQELIQ